MIIPLLKVTNLSKSYDNIVGCKNISMSLYPGEVLGIVGESGSGKTTLINCLSGNLEPDRGKIIFNINNEETDFLNISESEKRKFIRTDLAFVHQNPRDGLRLNVSAGGNIGEKLMSVGYRHYGNIRSLATKWINKVEIDKSRIDDLPITFSGGMLQRLQIAKNLITSPNVIFMDEPTGGLDVSVQARVLDLIRSLVNELNLTVIIVSHDLAVIRLLADKMIVMKNGTVIESGLSDQVLEDPQQEYTQLLVSSVLQV
jgi:putative phosphonate transport system ATP-binding protein